jgi:hypothetical protein
MSILCILTAIALAWAGKSGYEVFLITAFTGKVAQKAVEVKGDSGGAS